MALGTILREAREQQGFSVAQVAEATHMMTRVVEEIEREDFQRIAAPIYGRGFVKLYAEFLNLDAEPLVKEFNEIFSGSRRPVVATRAVKPAPSAANVAPASPSTASAASVASASPSAASVTSAANVAPASPSASPRLSDAALEPSAPAGTDGSAGASYPNRPRSTPVDPDARCPAPSRVADELDDLFGPRPGAPAAPKRSALSVERSAIPSPASRLPSPPLRRRASALKRDPSAPLRRCAAALKRIAAPLGRCASALHSAIPAGWRSGPALAGAAAGLLVIAAAVILVTRSSSSSSSSSSSPSRQSSRQSLDPPTTPLTIRTVLPPPEPYID